HHDSWQWINTMPTDRTNVLNRYNALWRQLATAFRGASPRLPFESGDAARVDPALAWFTATNDPNLIATVHYYGYWPFSVNVAGGTRFDATAQSDLTGAFDRVYNAFVARNIPVVIGELGL